MKVGVTGSITEPEDLPEKRLITGNTEVFIMVGTVTAHGSRLVKEDVGSSATIKATRLFEVPSDKIDKVQDLLGISLLP